MTEICWPSPQEWAAELRVTERDQIQKALSDDEGGRCCIGVLCDMANVPVEQYQNMYPQYRFEGHPSSGAIPCHLLPEWLPAHRHDEATEMNDDEGKSFAEIADWIDATLVDT